MCAEGLHCRGVGLLEWLYEDMYVIREIDSDGILATTTRIITWNAVGIFKPVSMADPRIKY